MIEQFPMSPKNAAAVTLGRRGGKARAKNQTVEQRIESARRAAQARWARADKLLEKTEESIARSTASLKELESRIAARQRRKKLKAL